MTKDEIDRKVRELNEVSEQIAKTTGILCVVRVWNVNFQNMEKLKRGDKMYLDNKAKTKESAINYYLSCRDGIVEVLEYNDMSGYGSKTRLFLCENTKHEVTSIVRQTWNDFAKEWIEEEMTFDTDSFVFLKALINNKKEELGGKYSLIRDY